MSDGRGCERTVSIRGGGSRFCAAAWGAAAIAYSVAFSLLPEQLAWRSLFWAGVFPALIVLFVRRNVEEPDIFLHARAKQRMSGEKSNLLAIFSPPLAMTSMPRRASIEARCTVSGRATPSIGHLKCAWNWRGC